MPAVGMLSAQCENYLEFPVGENPAPRHQSQKEKGDATT